MRANDPGAAPEPVRRATDDEGRQVVRRWLLRAGVIEQPLREMPLRFKLAVAAAVLGARDLGWLQGLELAIYDAQLASVPKAPSTSVVLVEITEADIEEMHSGGSALSLILDLDGACVSCGAAPGTLKGIQDDLLMDQEVIAVRFTVAMLEWFD